MHVGIAKEQENSVFPFPLALFPLGNVIDSATSSFTLARCATLTLDSSWSLVQERQLF